MKLGVKPVERCTGIVKFSDAMIELAFALSHAAKVEMKHRQS